MMGSAGQFWPNISPCGCSEMMTESGMGRGHMRRVALKSWEIQMVLYLSSCGLRASALGLPSRANW